MILTLISTVANYSGHCGSTLEITRTWRVTDGCGLSAQCQQTVDLVDTTPPSILCASNKTVVAGTPWNFDPPSAQDSVDGTNVSITVVNTQTNGLCGDTFSATPGRVAVGDGRHGQYASNRLIAVAAPRPRAPM